MYGIYLDGHQLPVTPSGLQIKTGNQNKTINLIDGSEVNLLKAPGLTDIAFDALLPCHRYPFAAASGSPATWLERLAALKAGRKPFRFVVTRDDAGFDTNLLVALEELTQKEDAGQGQDILVSLKLRQCPPYGTKTVVLREIQDTVVAAASTPRETTREAPASHTVVRGDNLWNLCKKYLGDGGKCWEIARLNGIADPNLIYPGQVIRFG